jgi:hypothetical protein
MNVGVADTGQKSQARRRALPLGHVIIPTIPPRASELVCRSLEIGGVKAEVGGCIR